MREHQIVITLKPEQFLEIQRLSKAAGAKSMGMFVRTELLRCLGIGKRSAGRKSGTFDGHGGEADREGRKRIQIVTQELRRIHGELQTFVAETLTESYVENRDALPKADLSAVESAFGAEDDPGEVVDIENHDDHVLSGDPAELFEEAKDELEQLAQKAFSISPRLGVLQSPAEIDPAQDEDDEGQDEDLGDPLEDLLDEGMNDPDLAFAEPTEAVDYEVSLGETPGLAGDSLQNDQNEQNSGNAPNPGQDRNSDPRHSKRHGLSGGPPPRRRKT